MGILHTCILHSLPPIVGSYDEKGLDKESRVWDGELCDLHSVETVNVITKCSPKCSYNSDSDHEALASKLLSYWETSNITTGGLFPLPNFDRLHLLYSLILNSYFSAQALVG